MYFARPGTAYGPGSFGSSFGKTTMSGFYDQNTKQVKPIEMINSKNTKNKQLVQQLWFERADKVV